MITTTDDISEELNLVSSLGEVIFLSRLYHRYIFMSFNYHNGCIQKELCANQISHQMHDP